MEVDSLLFKILIIGDTAVGKSSLLMRFSDDVFSENYITTIGVDFKMKTITLDGRMVKLQIWDTAGQEKFKTITNSYYRGANGIIVVYDVTQMATFENLQTWLNEISESVPNNVSTMLIGNKADLESSREVPTEQAAAYANEHGVRFFETSAKEALNVDLVFSELSRDILKSIDCGSARPQPPTGGVRPTAETTQDKGCC